MGEPHHYEVRSRILPVGTPGVTLNDIYNSLRRHPAPGAYPAPWASEDTGVKTDDISDIRPVQYPSFGRVRHDVDPNTYTVTNTTLPGHVFYPGTVKQTALIDNGWYTIDTTGDGTGDWPRLNEAIARPVWGKSNTDVLTDILAKLGPAGLEYYLLNKEAEKAELDTEATEKFVREQMKAAGWELPPHSPYGGVSPTERDEAKSKQTGPTNKRVNFPQRVDVEIPRSDQLSPYQFQRAIAAQDIQASQPTAIREQNPNDNIPATASWPWDKSKSLELNSRAEEGYSKPNDLEYQPPYLFDSTRGLNLPEQDRMDGPTIKNARSRANLGRRDLTR